MTLRLDPGLEIRRHSLHSLAILALPLALLVGCAGPPVVSEVALLPSPNANAPMAATIAFTTDKPARASLTIDDGEGITTVTPSDDLVTEHEVLVLGLLPGQPHQLTVTVADSGGRETVLEPLEFVAPEVPEDLPPISVPVRRPHLMEEGITLANLFRWTEEAGREDDKWGAIYGLDAEGRLRWWLTTDYALGEMRRLRNGNLFVTAYGFAALHEIDMLGNIVAAWHTRLAKEDQIVEGSVRVETDTFHHDVIELPNGNFLALSTEARWYEDWPSEYPPSTKTGPTHVIGDVLVEFARDGSIVTEHRILDILDPYRLGFGSLGTGFYEENYKEVLEEPGKDWAHSNAVYFLEEENAVVVSSNYQSVHYKLDWASGELQWLLGDPDGWKEPWSDKLLRPEGEVGWSYHHHGVERTPQGTWLLYDNGSQRAMPPGEGIPVDDRYSRAVEYAVDEAAGTVKEVWAYGPEQEWFLSPFISDADWLADTGNVLITDGGRMVGADGEQLRTFGGRNWGRVIEVTYGEDSEKVWELVVDDPARGYSIYRAQRIRSLYPELDVPTG